VYSTGEFSVNVATIFILPFIVIVSGLSEPDKSPLQPENDHPELADAVNSTESPRL